MPRLSNDIAYLSLEIGFEAEIPTYSGGLGVLAGDTLKAAADVGLPYVGVTLLYRGGYFSQKLGTDGGQTPEPHPWKPEDVLRPMTPRIVVPIDGREVMIRAWRLDIHGVNGHIVPVYYLDSDLPENDPEARTLTNRLYDGGPDHRIRQEAILGIGGRRILRAIGHDVKTLHMNEGHACFLCIELLSEYFARVREQTGQDAHLDAAAIAHVRHKCVFTTHTPVEAGHDRFAIERVRAIVGDHPLFERPDLYGEPGVLNTTRLAMNFSKFSNAVARKHGEISRKMFPGYPIRSITNGVHATSWASPRLRELFDASMPLWRQDNHDLRLAHAIPDKKLWNAHAADKADMLAKVTERTGVALDPDALTIVFARRMTDYKRPGLVFADTERLKKIARSIGPVQFVFAGKAHPHDGRGQEIIRTIHRAANELKGSVPVAFYPDYDIAIARHLVSGADVWLNNPRPPLEASGTSGMKAALNGVPSLSTLDGWWLEGWVEGVTGWAIGTEQEAPEKGPLLDEYDLSHAEAIYNAIEKSILPLYRRDRPEWIRVMKNAIALNGSYFTTQRMVSEYALRAYTA
jgi:starch phosphorylase